RLFAVIDSSEIYDRGKKRDIETLKRKLKVSDSNDLAGQFSLNQSLFDHYSVFKRDSAFTYALRTREIADKLDGSSFKIKAQLNLANICVSAGMYKEGLDYLSSIDQK